MCKIAVCSHEAIAKWPHARNKCVLPRARVLFADFSVCEGTYRYKGGLPLRLCERRRASLYRQKEWEKWDANTTDAGFGIRSEWINVFSTRAKVVKVNCMHTPLLPPQPLWESFTHRAEGVVGELHAPASSRCITTPCTFFHAKFSALAPPGGHMCCCGCI